MTQEIFVLQTRWLGGDEWTNGIYVADTEEAAYAAALAEENRVAREDAQETGELHVDWQSLAEVREAGNFDFWYEGWTVPVA